MVGRNVAAMVACVFGWAGAAMGAAPMKGPFPAETFQKARTYVEGQLSQAGVPGAAYGFLGRGNFYLASWGATNLETGMSSTPTHSFEIGSLVKLLTATAILQLRDQGLLKLEDPVQKVLPWFKVADKAYSSRITLRQLLTIPAAFL